MHEPLTKAAVSAQTEKVQADLTVVGGGGHVGIPLVLAFAEAGMTVNVNDLNEAVLALLRSGKLPFIEHGAAPLLSKALANNRLIFTSSPSAISRRGPVIVTIGTPVDEFLNPVQKAVQDCIDALLPYLSDDQLLVLRSTVYPGTTAWLDSYLKRLGRNIKVAFCPERVVQGNGIKELHEMPQIVSGTSKEAEEEAVALFQQDRAGGCGDQAARGRIRQAVQQCLPLYRICRHQPVLHDREIRRRGLSRDHAGDEAQLPAPEDAAAARFCGRSLLVQGYDAARRLCAQSIRARPTRRCR